MSNGIYAPDGSLRVTKGSDGDIPVAATRVSATSGNVANGSAAATIPAVSGKTNYLTGFQIFGAGATAALAVDVTVTGLLGGTLTYTYGFVAGATLANTPINVAFDPPLPASAVNTAIVVTCPAGGSGAAKNTVNAQGYVI